MATLRNADNLSSATAEELDPAMTGALELDLFVCGPEAVTSAVRSHIDVNVKVLADACAREARSSASDELAFAWTHAAICAYEKESSRFPWGIAYHGLQAVPYGLRASMIMKFGLESATTRHYLAEIQAWLQDIVRRIGVLRELEDLRASSDFRRREVGLVAQERFQCLAQL